MHEISFASHRLSSGRGASMPPLERATDPHALATEEMRRVAFVLAEGIAAYDFEDPAAAVRFMQRRAADSPNVDDGGVADDDGGDREGRGPEDGSVVSLPTELWSLVLGSCDAWGLRVVSCLNSTLAALVDADGLWLAMQSRLLGLSPPLPPASPLNPPRHDERAERLRSCMASPRARCIQSDAAIARWTRAFGAAARELPLPGMLAICLAGEVGVSVHHGRMTRLWEASSGRRLACFQHRAKHALTCCDASGCHAAVGDAGGTVHVFELESDFAPRQTLYVDGGPAGASAAPITSVSFVGSDAAASPLCAFGRADGMVRVHEVHLAGGGTHLPIWTTFIGADPHAVGLGLAAGAPGELYVATGHYAAQYNLERGAPVWEADLVEAVDVGDALATRRTDQAAQRVASYSVGWRLLAVASADGDVQLYDTRVSATAGPVASVCLPRGQPAASVHLDAGHESSGHLLISALAQGAAGGAVSLYDIRRAVAARGAAHSHGSAGALTTPIGHVRGGACFTADGARLVWGGGPKEGRTFVANLAQAGRDARDGAAAGAGGSARYAWRRRYAAEHEEAASDDDAEAGLVPSPHAPTPKSRTRKARGTKKQWSH